MPCEAMDVSSHSYPWYINMVPLVEMESETFGTRMILVFEALNVQE